MESSKFLTLNSFDYYKSLLTGALVTAFYTVLNVLYELLTAKGFHFTGEDLEKLGVVFVSGIVGYLVKNFFSNSQGNFGKVESSSIQ